MKKVIQKQIQRLETLEHQIKMEQIQHSKMKSYKQDFGCGLSCKKVRGNFRYYINGKYVSKQKDSRKIADYAKAEYQRKLKPLLEKEIKCLKRVLETEERLSETYNKLYEGKRILFEPDIIPVSEKKKQFENSTHNGLGFAEDDRTDYYTNRGERVRSKSEKIIADELARHGIPYKYEKPLQLMVDRKIKEFYPDFTVMNITTGEIKYLEHLGMMDHPGYFKNTLSKLDAYEKNNLLIGRDVILLHESAYHPLNTRVILEYINEFLL